jgi:hypothetical protein
VVAMRRSIRRRLGSGLAFVLVASGLSVLYADPAQAATTITVDGTKGGRVFDGIGAASGGGGNSRLLIDYPEPQRSEILDYLFKPGYGAALQILKVEVGGDMNSTDGAEPSHMHSATDENYDRGYEWWLMEQAKARNPNIKLGALSWGAPGWIGGGNFWSTDMITYLVKWLKGAKAAHNLTIDYLGGWNENGYNKGWFENLRTALNNNGLNSTKIVAADSGWDVANDLATDSTFKNAVDIVGAHYPCEGGDGGTAYSCSTTSNALASGKQLWASENGSQDYNTGAPAMARAITLGYVDAKMTSYINWPVIAALPPNLPFQTTGLAVANQPWSGWYGLGKQLWTTAHVSQFTQPGWSFIDSASGLLGGNRVNGSYITLKSGANYSTVIETTRATAAQTASFQITGGLSTGAAHVWATNLNSGNANDWFVHTGDVTPSGGSFTMTLQPGYVYTVSTIGTAGKGAAASPASAAWQLPYSDNFDANTVGHEAKYIADQDGALETVACGGGRSGRCIRQMAPAAPIYWHGHAGYPYATIGAAGWSNYTISSDVLLEQAGSVELIGRYTARDYWEIGHVNAYFVKVSSAGAWSIVKSATNGTLTTLASGTVAALGVNTWHKLAATFQGATISASIDGATVGSATDGSYVSGPAGLASGLGDGWHNVQYDNLSITPGAANSAYKLINRQSGKALAVAGGDAADGAKIVQWTDNGSASQKWQVLSGGGYTTLVNAGSGKALDVPGFATTTGTQLVQWTANGGTNQQWTATASGGYSTLASRTSNLCVDVSGGSTADGAQVIQWTCTGGMNQQWSLVPAP